jgi:hypothetical protein
MEKIEYESGATSFDLFIQAALEAGHLKINKTGTVRIGEMYSLYEYWAQSTGRHTFSILTFAKQVNRIGMPQIKGAAGRRLRGGMTQHGFVIFTREGRAISPERNTP